MAILTKILVIEEILWKYNATKLIIVYILPNHIAQIATRKLESIQSTRVFQWNFPPY